MDDDHVVDEMLIRLWVMSNYICSEFNINGDTKSVSTPLAPHFKLKATMSPTTVEGLEYMSHNPMPTQLVV